MFSNYLKTSIRIILQNKVFSLINIVGLALGMACCIMISLYVQHELSYDRFHKKADQIHRVSYRSELGNEASMYAKTPAPLAQALVNDYPEVMAAARIYRGESQTVEYEDNVFKENRIFYADPSLFTVFSIPFFQGNAATALEKPNSVVITRTTAEKYFGDNNPAGKSIRFEGSEVYRITGVIEDVPANSHFHYDFLASFSTLERSRSDDWDNSFLYTYIVLQRSYPANRLESKFPGLLEKYIGPDIEQAFGMTLEEYKAKTGRNFGYFLQPLKKIHLYSDIESEIEANGDIRHVYIFSIIAVFIMIIACINFINLSTARSTTRSMEVGMRKVFGSQRRQLIQQFLGESVLFSAIGVFFGMILVEISLPLFERLSGRQIDIQYFSNPIILAGTIGLCLFVGIVAGYYPAFLLSSFHPMKVLKGKMQATGKSYWMKNLLVVVQFTISIILIICTLTIYKQLSFMSNKSLGFNKQQVVVIKGAGVLDHQLETFSQEVADIPAVVAVSASSSVPGKDFSSHTRAFEGASSEDMRMVSYVHGDYGFLNTFGIGVKEGKYFSKDFPTDRDACLLNEMAVQSFGLSDPIGKKYHERYGGLTVIGVVKDFHFSSLHDRIQPLAIYPFSNHSDEMAYFSVKIQPQNIHNTVNLIREKWEQLVKNEPFEYYFLDDSMDDLYRAERKAGTLLFIFSVLTIFIASLGLIGLASFTAKQKTQEIGVRKVLGSSVWEIIVLLTKDFMRWVLLANLVAWPAAYFAMTRWMENFAYRTGISWWIFLFAGGLAITLSWLTVGYLTFRAARADPVVALRYE